MSLKSEKFKELSILIIPLIIITSPFKTFGYATSFYLFLPLFIHKFQILFNYLKNSDLTIKLVSFFIFTLIIYSFIGSNTLNDYRVLFFWVPYFFVCLCTYLYHNYKIQKDYYYSKNFPNYLYYSSLVFLVLYFLINIISLVFYKNWYDIQNDFWIGGSSSFCISAILFTQIFNRWVKANLKIFSSYFFITVFYTFLIFINHSRLGILYLSAFLVFIILASINKKQIVKGLVIISIISICYSSFGIFIQENSSPSKNFPYIYQFNNTENIKKIISSPKNQIVEELREINNEILRGKQLIEPKNKFKNADARFFELSVGWDKFEKSSLIKKLIGTGWYSSRVTINSSRNRMIDDHGEQLKIKLIKNEINQLQGIVALLLDAGFLGICFFAFLIAISFQNIAKSKFPLINKCFYSVIILINIFCLFIGYPMVMLSYILMQLPKGILFTDK